VIALYILIALIAATFIFILGWACCRQAQVDARNSASYANGRLLAANQMLMDATEREAQTAKRIESAAESFDGFRKEHEGLRLELRGQTQRLEQILAGLRNTGVVPRADGARQVNPPPVRAFSGPRSTSTAPEISATGPPTPSTTLIS
jgi:hypothetical protein